MTHISNMLCKNFKKLFSKLYYLFNKRKFGSYSSHSYILPPFRIDGMAGIYINEDVIIQEDCWIATDSIINSNPILQIGKGCVIGRNNEIYATKSIVIEDNVLTADRVYISDNLHDYRNPDVPVINQPIKQIKTVRIGEGSWIGIGVAVIGAKIGKHCVIGANAVVTKDIPDYSIAVGIPAKVIKQYDWNKNEWTDYQ